MAYYDIPNWRYSPYQVNGFYQYVGTPGQIYSYIGKLFSSTFVDNAALLFADPADTIISIQMFPFNLHDYLEVETVDLTVGTVKFANTSAYLTVSPKQSNRGTIPMGTITIPRNFNNFLDYSPYTAIDIFLPFIGYRALDVDAVMGTTLGIHYAVDYFQGRCTAFVSTASGNPILTASGQMSVQLPFGGPNAREIANAGLMGALRLVGGLVGVGITAASGGSTGAIVGGLVAATANYAADAFTANQERYNRGGIADANLSLYDSPTPYVIIKRPITSIPSNYNSLYGRPSMKSATLSSLTGYTKVAEVHVEGSDFSGATAGELGEIERLLKEGVIL